MSPTLPNLTLFRLPKLKITNCTGWGCLDLSSVSVLMCVNLNTGMLMLKRSGYGDRYVASQSRLVGSSGHSTLSSLPGDVRVRRSGLARRRRLSCAEYCQCRPRSPHGTIVREGSRLVCSFWYNVQPTGHSYTSQAAAIFHRL